jgi:hypothetical protein
MKEQTLKYGQKQQTATVHLSTPAEIDQNYDNY